MNTTTTEGLSTPIRSQDKETTRAQIKRMLGFLPMGREHPMGSHEIQERLNLPRLTDVAALINAARRENYPIGSIHGQGYFIMIDREDLAVTEAHLLKRQAGITKTIEDLHTAYSVWIDGATS